MRRLTYLLAIFFILSLTSTSYAQEKIDRELKKLDEKYYLLKEENQKQRNEILRLYNILSPKKADKIPVLLYHHILKEEEIKTHGWKNNHSVISLENFREQMKYLHDNCYYTATLDELQKFIEGTEMLPQKTVVITFDDGYLSNAVYAHPIMKDFGFKGTIFMRGSVSTYPQQAFNPKGLQVISIGESYKYEDVFEYGSHTFNLHKINENNVALMLALTKDEIIDDLEKNKELWDSKCIAYPFGKYNKNTVEYIKELGYEMGFTVKSGYVRQNMDKFQLPRFIIGPKTSIVEFRKILE